MSQRNGTSGEADTPGALWGRQLKRARQALGITQETLAKDLGFSRSTLAGYEAGKDVPSRTVAAQCDKLLQTSSTLADMWDDTNWYPAVAIHPGWFQRRADMDAKAVEIREYQLDIVPGLLQTADYARAVFELTNPQATPQEIDVMVAARISRQERFLKLGGPQLIVVMDESCLARMVGTRATMVGQLDQLLTVGELPNVRLQVLLLTTPNVAPPTSSMSFITLPDGRRWLYAEALDQGLFHDSPVTVAQHDRHYAVLQADALSAVDTAAWIRSVRKGLNENDDASESERSPLAQVQLQRRQRRQLHRSSPRIHRRSRPGA
jgi:transcriptional regulator with XRE-family HTH domain